MRLVSSQYVKMSFDPSTTVLICGTWAGFRFSFWSLSNFYQKLGPVWWLDLKEMASNTENSPNSIPYHVSPTQSDVIVITAISTLRLGGTAQEQVVSQNADAFRGSLDIWAMNQCQDLSLQCSKSMWEMGEAVYREQISRIFVCWLSSKGHRKV